jgi:hypothetical protein
MSTSWDFAQGVFVNGIDAFGLVMKYRACVQMQRSWRREN